MVKGLVEVTQLINIQINSNGEDFPTKMSGSKGGRPAIDHTLKLDMAKELLKKIQREIAI